MALSYIGGESAQIALGLPLALASVFQGMLLFFLLACDVLINYRLAWRNPLRQFAVGAARQGAD